MTIFGIRRRVACYVTRTVGQGQELLVFEHADDDPADPSGIQVPAGGMLPFEGIEAAALRETEEETGLGGCRFVEQLGGQERHLHERGGPSTTTFVHLLAPSDGPSGWEHTVTGVGSAAGDLNVAEDGEDAGVSTESGVREDAGMVFVCRWEPLPLQVKLADDQAEFIRALTS